MPRALPTPAIFALLAWLTTAPASAQAPAEASPIPRGEPSAYRFYAAPGSGSFLMVDGTQLGREWEPAISVLVDYAHRPFALDEYEYYTYTREEPGGPELDVVGGMLTIQLTGAVAVADIVQLGVNLPIVAYTWGAGHMWTETSSTGAIAPSSIPSGSGATLGDPRIHGKVRLFDTDLGGGASLGAAAVGWIAFPLARAILPRRYAGESSVAGGGHVVLGFRYQALRIALNAGVGVREEARIILSRRTTEMTWGGALAYDFNEMFGALVEITGETTFGLVYDDEAPTELRAAAYLRAGDLTFTLGGGVGIAHAIGVPVFRVLGGAMWDPRPRADLDGDRVVDELDACPSEAEDIDQNTDDDGCPDEDDDGDGIADASDACRTEPEDIDEHEDGDGCPDSDDDGDGVPDGYDSCPSELEDRDGDRDTDGCPDDDRDRDRIPDDRDACVDQAEDTDGLADEDGCPEEDFDGDGIADVDDECADQAEDRDGHADRDGCPDRAPGQDGRGRGR